MVAKIAAVWVPGNCSLLMFEAVCIAHTHPTTRDEGEKGPWFHYSDSSQPPQARAHRAGTFVSQIVNDYRSQGSFAQYKMSENTSR